MSTENNVLQLSQPLEQSLESAAAVVAQRCYEDEEFRRRLLQEPRATLEKFMGRELPASFQIELRENMPGKWHIPLSDDILSDQELEKISAGEVGTTAGIIALLVGASVTSVVVGVGITGALWGSGKVPL